MSIASTREFIEQVKAIASNADYVIDVITGFSKVSQGSRGFVEQKFMQGVFLKKEYKKLVVVGDLHGDFWSLIKILDNENIFDEAKNTLMVFLGDYIDRGYMQVETILAVYLLKIMYPGNVVVLRGNHEPPPDLVPYPHDFPEVLFSKYGGKWGEVYRYFMLSFQRMPLFAIVPGEIFFVHGGPPKNFLEAKTYLQALLLTTPLPDDLVVEEVLWSDPLEGGDVDYAPSYRGAGILYGKTVVEKALELTNTKVIIRAHEPVVGGFKTDHDGLVVTVFSSKVYGSSQVAYLSIPGGVVEPEMIPSFIKKI